MDHSFLSGDNVPMFSQEEGRNDFTRYTYAYTPPAMTFSLAADHGQAVRKFNKGPGRFANIDALIKQQQGKSAKTIELNKFQEDYANKQTVDLEDFAFPNYKYTPFLL